MTRSDIDDYVGRLNGLVISLEGLISPAGLAEAQHLIDHGEGPEGMRALAWIIVDERREVPRWIIEAILELGGGLVRTEDWPAELWAYSGGK